MSILSLVIPAKEDENRRAMLPADFPRLQFRDRVVVEKGYGEVLGIYDSDYAAVCAGVVSHEEAYDAQIICDVKGPRPHTFDLYKKGQIAFGWQHLEENMSRGLTSLFMQKQMTAIEWALLQEPRSQGLTYIFSRNRYLAGQAGVMQALDKMQITDLSTKKVALVGLGNVGQGALDALRAVQATVHIYHRNELQALLRNIRQYDVVVDSMLWDRATEVPPDEDVLSAMKKGALVINIGWGLLKASPVTPYANPIARLYNIHYYGVDNTPSYLPREASEVLSQALPPYIDALVQDDWG